MRCRSLLLGNNAIDGAVPDWVGNLPAVQFVDLSFNAFTGTIPSSYSNLSVSAKELRLGGNALTGTLPQWLEHFGVLQFLDVSDNAFTGTLPDVFNGAANLKCVVVVVGVRTGRIVWGSCVDVWSRWGGEHRARLGEGAHVCTCAPVCGLGSVFF